MQVDVVRVGFQKGKCVTHTRSKGYDSWCDTDCECTLNHVIRSQGMEYRIFM